MAQTLSAPWYRLYKEIEAMFKQDSEVFVLFEQEKMTVKVYVSDSLKAAALEQILTAQHRFGNTLVNVVVMMPNGADGAVERTTVRDCTYECAFNGNKAVNYVMRRNNPFGDFTYVVFKPEVVQYYNDDLSDLYGNKSTLYQEIARNIFNEEPMTFFCTDHVTYEGEEE